MMNRRRSQGLASVAIVVALLVPGAAMAESKDDRADASEAPPARRSVIERWRNATAVERIEMRQNLRERRRDASPRQRRRIERRMRRLARALPDFSAIERLILLRAAADLPKAEQDDLRRRIADIDDLEPEERAALIADLQSMIQGFEGEVERLERNRDRWEGMSRAEKDEFRDQLKRLKKMSPEDRRALFEEMEKRREQ